MRADAVLLKSLIQLVLLLYEHTRQFQTLLSQRQQTSFAALLLLMLCGVRKPMTNQRGLELDCME